MTSRTLFAFYPDKHSRVARARMKRKADVEFERIIKRQARQFEKEKNEEYQNKLRNYHYALEMAKASYDSKYEYIQLSIWTLTLLNADKFGNRLTVKKNELMKLEENYLDESANYPVPIVFDYLDRRWYNPLHNNEMYINFGGLPQDVFKYMLSFLPKRWTRKLILLSKSFTRFIFHHPGCAGLVLYYL